MKLNGFQMYSLVPSSLCLTLVIRLHGTWTRSLSDIGFWQSKMNWDTDFTVILLNSVKYTIKCIVLNSLQWHCCTNITIICSLNISCFTTWKFLPSPLDSNSPSPSTSTPFCLYNFNYLKYSVGVDFIQCLFYGDFT